MLMKLPKTNFETMPGAVSSQQKTVWTGIMTATPVLLTVLATVLAGLSSSEMTLAQYHRALAAQNQSKAGDQWSFFQAKRIRGTNLETTVDLLQAISERNAFDAEQLVLVAEQTLKGLRRLEREADEVRELLTSSAEKLGSGSDFLRARAVKLSQILMTSAKAAEAIKGQLQDALAATEVQNALTSLTRNEPPPLELGAIEDAQLQKAVQAVQLRQADTETAPLIGIIADESLRRALLTAENHVQAVESAEKPINAAFAQVDTIITDFLNIARPLHREMRELDPGLIDLPSGENASITDLRSLIGAMARTTTGLKSAAEELNRDFKAARYGYTARRYEREARANQQAAMLYEVQVRKSSLDSERHRTRSKHFFYGMLAAQAGVTIAAFALAVKHKSLLWSLATSAGLGAVLFGLYVYVYM
jgi:hypothetical protein